MSLRHEELSLAMLGITRVAATAMPGGTANFMANALIESETIRMAR